MECVIYGFFYAKVRRGQAHRLPVSEQFWARNLIKRPSCRLYSVSWVYPREYMHRSKTIYIINKMYDFLFFRTLWRLSNMRYPVFYSSSPLTLYDSSRALPPPAHHSSARPLLASHPAHPLPAHMQPTAVYGLTPLSPAKHQYQPPSLWFTE